MKWRRKKKSHIFCRRAHLAWRLFERKFISKFAFASQNVKLFSNFNFCRFENEMRLETDQRTTAASNLNMKLLNAISFTIFSWRPSIDIRFFSYAMCRWQKTDSFELKNSIPNETKQKSKSRKTKEKSVQTSRRRKISTKAIRSNEKSPIMLSIVSIGQFNCPRRFVPFSWRASNVNLLTTTTKRSPSIFMNYRQRAKINETTEEEGKKKCFHFGYSAFALTIFQFSFHAISCCTLIHVAASRNRRMNEWTIEIVDNLYSFIRNCNSRAPPHRIKIKWIFRSSDINRTVLSFDERRIEAKRARKREVKFIRK